jgi:hypothetical protein
MPPADRLIIDKAVPVAVAHRQDPQDLLGTGRHAEHAQPDGLPRSELASAASSWMAALAPMPWQPADSSAGPHAPGAAPSRGYGADTTWPYAGSIDDTGYESTAEVPLQISAIPPAGSAAVSATAVDVAMVRCVLDALTAHERQFGGGEARAYAMDYLRRMVWPRLHAVAGAPAFGDLCALAAEFSLRAASMQLDAGSAGASRDLLGAGLPLAQESGDPVLVAWVLARFGELDVRQKNVDRAVAYTGGAAAMARRATPRARSFILAKHALALSVAGDRTATLRVWARPRTAPREPAAARNRSGCAFTAPSICDMTRLGA